MAHAVLGDVPDWDSLENLPEQPSTRSVAFLSEGAFTVAAVTDISERKRSEQALTEQARLLDVSRIISGTLRLERATIDLADVVRTAVDGLQPLADKKRIELALDTESSLSTFYADPGRLQQIVVNLLSNAIKFTPVGGSVHLRVRRVDSLVEIVVTDTGQGIPADFLPSAFEAFRQADESLTRRHGGLGLGLSIVKHLVEAGCSSLLLDAIAHIAFSDFDMRGVVARRRVAFFGQSYDRMTVGPLPTFLLPLRTRIAQWAGVDPDAFAMALINEYRPGSPIGWHRDAPQYDIVAGISLLSACRMRFRPYRSPSSPAPLSSRRSATLEVALARRSAYLLTHESRTAYEHHIPPVIELRYSLTFRTLR